MTGRTAALAASFVAGLSLGTTAPASGLIDNVNGITTDAAGRVIRFNGLLIDARGRIEQRLQPSDKRPKTLDFRYDGKGQTLIPAFVDARSELMPLAIALLSLDLGPSTSFADMAARVGAYVAGGPGRRWILGAGWDDADWPAGEARLLAALDAAAPGHPLWLLSADGERGWANSAAMKLAGVTNTTPQPDGGEIGKANGQLTGLFTGRAMDLVAQTVPPPAPKDLDVALPAAQSLFLRRGITAVGDVRTGITAWQAYRRAGDRNALRLRISGFAPTLEELALVAGPAPSPALYDNRLQVTGIALTIDGSLAAGRAAMTWRKASAPPRLSMPLLDGTRLRNQLSRAAMDGFRIALSAHGDRATAEAVAAISEIAPSYGGRLRWRFDGMDVATPETLAAMPAGSIVTVAPALLREPLPALPDQPTALSYPWARMAANGVPLAFSGIAPFAPLRPFEAMRLAMTREPQGADPARLSFGAALRAATAGGAAAIGMGDRLGALEPEQFADFLILDRDIELTRPQDIGATRILEIWMAGRKMQVEPDR